MGGLMLIAKLFLRQPDTVNSICFSLLVLVLLNPFYLLDIGLMLSYAGTIGIIAFAKMGKSVIKNMSKIKEVLWVCFSAQCFIMPITVYFFNTANVTFFISNLLVFPLFGLIIGLGFACIFISYLCMPFAKLLRRGASTYDTEFISRYCKSMC